VTQLCGWVLWLVDGQPRLTGPATEVVNAYLSAGTAGHEAWLNAQPAPDTAEVQFKRARLLSADCQPAAVMDFDRPFQIEIDYEVLAPTRALSLTCQIFDTQGNMVFETLDTDMPELKDAVREPGQYRARCTVTAPLLKPGRYHITLVSFIERVKIIERQENVLTFDVSEVGYRLNPGRMGIVSPVLPWTVEPLV
jgi:hypothetical protein